MTNWAPQDYAPPVLSLTESQAFTSLRSFLLAVVAPGTDVIRAEYNRVPEPVAGDFIVMTQIAQDRLDTNETTFTDNILVGSIAGSILTVTSLIGASVVTPGELLTDTLWPTMNVAVGTIVGTQLTGTPGGVGTYTVTPSQTVASERMYAGTRADQVAVKLTIQLDVHGPASADNSRVIETLFRSEYAVDLFATFEADVAPLYCDTPRQVPFLNAEQQYEFRWSMDAHLQVNPVVTTPQQFADEIIVKVVEVAFIPEQFRIVEVGGNIRSTENGTGQRIVELGNEIYTPRSPPLPGARMTENLNPRTTEAGSLRIIE